MQQNAMQWIMSSSKEGDHSISADVELALKAECTLLSYNSYKKLLLIKYSQSVTPSKKVGGTL